MSSELKPTTQPADVALAAHASAGAHPGEGVIPPGGGMGGANGADGGSLRSTVDTPAPPRREPLDLPLPSRADAREVLRAVREHESRSAFLARASMVLGSTLDSVATADHVARLAVPELADICIIDLWTEGPAPRRAAVVHGDPGSRALHRLLSQAGPAAGSPQEVAWRTGRAQIGTFDTGGSLPWPADSEDGRMLAALGVQSWLLLPLRSRNQTLGVVSLLSIQRRPCAADDFATAGEFVRRAAIALDNALLYESALRARAAAEAAQEQFQLLVDGLRESEDKYRTLFEESRDAIYITLEDGRFIDVNPAMLELFGYSRAEMLRLNAQELYAEAADRERFRREIARQGSVREYELVLRTRAGERLDCLLSSMLRRTPAGQVVGYQGIIHDITDRKRAEVRLMESEHFTRTIITSVQQGVVVFNRELRYQAWNRFMEELTGLPASEVIGAHMTEVHPQLDDLGIAALVQRALLGETVQSPDLRSAPAGAARSSWISCVFSPHVSRTGEVMGVVGIVHDITDRKRAEALLVHNAFHDSLTGLPNRSLFVDRLERLLRQRDRHPLFTFGVAFMDLDRFKVVNDSLGHLRGDELLVAIARRLEKCIRQGDTVARLGGDEFAVLLHDVKDVRDATRVADRILTELSSPFRLGSHDVYTAASIGIALSSTGYDRPDEILRDADIAMYRAKLEGRCRYEVFDRNMHERAVQTLQVETDLRRALERCEFRVHYQPIIDLAAGRIAGFEALLRWQHPSRGLLLPDSFLPLAEETGLIVTIGWWVLEEACVRMQAWRERFPARPDLHVAVNLSTRQFMQPDLLQQIDAVLARTGLAPGALTLEITESAVVLHEEAVTTSLAALRARGIRLCIDDFGTGYSSLSYLHSFPVDALKIDRSFISQSAVAASSARLVETIVALGRNLGMTTVAEGVETAGQLAFVRAAGPQFAQGFHFSPPLTHDGIAGLLEAEPGW
jgi:diguanylate cyclase (GGDEF)-like protein/PAS domain S-box-containing protein